MSLDAPRRPTRGWWAALGPAFVAAVAYVDPGNVAANLSAGERYGYLLVWVLVISSMIAVLVQYRSAKLGLVTGKTLTTHIVDHVSRWPGGIVWHFLFGLQALLVAVATEIAEIIGGALALYLLFGLPVWVGGLVVAGVSLAVLAPLRSRGEKVFELVVVGILTVIAVGFLASLAWAPPSPTGIISGLVPRFAGADSVLLAASMLGATVMPHAVYLHSRLAIDRYLRVPNPRPLRDLLRLQRLDVLGALALAGSVNIAMLLFAATALQGSHGSGEVEDAHALIASHVSPVAATVFAVGLLASGFGSTIVGTHAGAGILHNLTPVRFPPWLRRLMTIGPAVLLLFTGVGPTTLLVWSQAALSFGLPFALIPLLLFTGSHTLMGQHRDRWPLRTLGWVLCAAVVALNVYLLVTLF